MNAIIVSDLHIGSKYFLHQEFLKFFKSIPETFDIILNGDIIDNPYKKLNLPNQHIMDLIEQIYYRQRVVWVLGNHDNGGIPDEFGNVRITRTHALGHKLLVTHGHDFDEIMPRNFGFMKIVALIPFWSEYQYVNNEITCRPLIEIGGRSLINRSIEILNQVTLIDEVIIFSSSEIISL